MFNWKNNNDDDQQPQAKVVIIMITQESLTITSINMAIDCCKLDQFR